MAGPRTGGTRGDLWRLRCGRRDLDDLVAGRLERLGLAGGRVLAESHGQIASLRRKAENRERALRKIILECGLSNLDLETRLRAIEGEQRSPTESINAKDTSAGDGGLEDLMSDAMSETVVFGEREVTSNDATIHAADTLRALESKSMATQRGWKDYIWGGTSRKSSRASSVNGDSGNAVESATVRLLPQPTIA